MPQEKSEKKAEGLDEALTRFANAYARGEPPDIDGFVAQYPEHEAQIRRRAGSLREIDALFDSLVRADAHDFEETAPERELVGQRIGSFEIVEIIGRGGMGVVYLAHDTKLNRSVAIKTMPARLAADATARMRFRHEAEMLASLNHPNIGVIHDIIEEEPGYFILEYVPGETLAQRIARGPIKVEEALAIGKQIIEAIAAAHEKGVVHRDLKPGNIKITPEGRVKVLDFGLAKSAGLEASGREGTVTQDGHIVGTPAYMSPEQARGKPTDQRTDIWSFGCVLYQMLTGQLPFDGKTTTDILARVIEREPDWEALPRETPTRIRALLRSCLEKDPGRRLQHMNEAVDEIVETLRVSSTRQSVKRTRRVLLLSSAAVVCLSALGMWLFLREKQTVASPEEIRLVVLPFDHVGPVENAWFADAVSSEIADRLSGVHGLAVIARHSAFQCRQRQMTTGQIAQKLNVDYILEGTIQCEDPKDPNSTVKLRLQLVETASDTQVWSHPFDRDRRQFFALQSEVAEQVAQQLDILLLEQDRTWSKYIPTTENLEAYNLWLQGNALGSQNSKAIPFYEEALKLDPNFARAHSALAWVQTHMYFFGEDRSPEHLVKAGIEAHSALKLAPDIPGIQVAMARYYYQGLRDYERALEHLEKARELHPNHTWMLFWTHAVHRRRGDFEEAVPNIERACELDPLSAYFASYAGALHEFRRDYPKAKRYYEQANLTDPNWAGGWELRAWLQLLWHGDLATARDVMEDGLKRIDPTTYPREFCNLMVTIDIWDGRYQDALTRLSEAPEAPETSAWPAHYALQKAQIYGYLENKALAKQSYESARAFLEDKVDEHPDVAEYHSLFGRAYAGLGDKEKALEHGELGTKLLPVTKDAGGGARRVEDLARIYVMVGKHELAIEQLEYLLSIPSRFSRQLLRLDPTWKPLQKYPRFQKLVESGS